MDRKLTKAQRKLLSRIPMAQETKYCAFKSMLVSNVPMNIAELRSAVQDEGAMVSGQVMLRAMRELEREHLVSPSGAAGRVKYKLSKEALAALDHGDVVTSTSSSADPGPSSGNLSGARSRPAPGVGEVAKP